MRSFLLTLMLLPAFSRAADPLARGQEHSYLRVLIPETLLEFAHGEVHTGEHAAPRMESLLKSGFPTRS